jgi:hypothetical protein
MLTKKLKIICSFRLARFLMKIIVFGSRKVKRDDQSVEEYRNLVLAELKSITASGKLKFLSCGPPFQKSSLDPFPSTASGK